MLFLMMTTVVDGVAFEDIAAQGKRGVATGL